MLVQCIETGNGVDALCFRRLGLGRAHLAIDDKSHSLLAMTMLEGLDSNGSFGERSTKVGPREYLGAWESSQSMEVIEHIYHRRPNLLGNVFLHVTQSEMMVRNTVASSIAIIAKRELF